MKKSNIEANLKILKAVVDTFDELDETTQEYVTKKLFESHDLIHNEEKVDNKEPINRNKYYAGEWINKKWIIVSILYVRKQNKKILCYNPEHNIFKEGWIWDFTRNIVKPMPNKKAECFTICELKLNTELYSLLDTNFEYANEVYFKTNYLTREEYSILRGYREGSFWDVEHILKKFDFLLSDDYNKCGQSRRNQNLAHLIASTYIILIQKGVI